MDRYGYSGWYSRIQRLNTLYRLFLNVIPEFLKTEHDSWVLDKNSGEENGEAGRLAINTAIFGSGSRRILSSVAIARDRAAQSNQPRSWPQRNPLRRAPIPRHFWSPPLPLSLLPTPLRFCSSWLRPLLRQGNLASVNFSLSNFLQFRVRWFQLPSSCCLGPNPPNGLQRSYRRWPICSCASPLSWNSTIGMRTLLLMEFKQGFAYWTPNSQALCFSARYTFW